MDVVLIHGYNVTSTKTYGVLPKRLKAAGHAVKDVYLSKYVTLDDDISLPDLVRGLEAALRDLYGATYGRVRFACITHSTGGLVARSWIETFHSRSMARSPMSHLIMLAPPTNGSRLAELGKSRLSRLRNLIGIEPGLRVLDALELGSKFQWDLNTTWMRKKLHASAKFFPFVITGQWIDKKLWDAIIPATYERGSDGVVRASAANLNMQRITVGPDGGVVREVMGGVAFLVAPKTSHSDTTYGIMGSIPEHGDHPVLNAILQALAVKSRTDYAAVEADFATKTTMLQRNETYYDGTPLERYCQLVFRITDNRGWPLSDYAIELWDGLRRSDMMPSGFFSDKHQNEVSAEQFCYYLNYDRLRDVRGGKFGFRVQSVANTPLINYAESVYLAPTDVGSLLQPNQTTFVDVIMRRRINRSVFELTDDFSEQKISGKPGPDWIE